MIFAQKNPQTMAFPQYSSSSFYAVNSSDFDRDVEFKKLIGRSENVDQTVLLMELARDRNPDLQFESIQNWINDRVTELRTTLLKSHDSIERLELIVRNFVTEHGMYGLPGYEDEPSSNDIDCLIEHKCGSPIALAVLFQAIAGPLGVETEILALSPRMLLRYETVEQTVFIDLYDSGSIQNFESTSSWLQEKNNMNTTEAEQELEQHPVSARKLVLRSLNHIKRSLKNTEDFERLWKVQLRLAALKPASYEERRDLGLTALKAKRPGKAVCILQNCLKSCPATESSMLSQSLEDAKQQVTLWN